MQNIKRLLVRTTGISNKIRLHTADWVCIWTEGNWRERMISSQMCKLTVFDFDSDMTMIKRVKQFILK